VTLEHAAFHDLPPVHARLGAEPLAGALFDLGVSSPQLDAPERGMSFRAEGPLDLRMDRSRGPAAAGWLASVEPRDLARVVARASGTHPRRLAQVFQALRIEVNDELRELDAALAWLPDAVRPEGVVVTLAYHSGEDRRIKQALRGAPATGPTRRVRRFVDSRAPESPWLELTRKVVTPSEQEIASNPRARSARLRAFRRKPS